MLLNRHEAANGFTMIELLIVIVILGLLASLVAPKFFTQLGTAERGVAEAQMNAFETALDTYRLDMGKYPEKLDELRTSEDARWNGPYLPKAIPKDPWGADYVYERVSNGEVPYTLMSYGADGHEGGTDADADIIHH
ncbi:type II secretion system major pseudopilin GspG [Paraglaciecola sp.]|uniref:type II secretion system major pseudopilin GspG n=1 Tax=Paraglaciecola sp. TaxID=1920173 RepID=UPI0030F3F7A1